MTARVPEDQRKPRGHPSSYTKAIADAICQRIACGQSMTSICDLEGMPKYQTIMEWRRNIPGFTEAIEAARLDQADNLVEEIVDVARAEAVTDEMGKVDAGRVAHNRLLIDTLRWRASKLKPKVYGDKVQQEVSGPGGGPLRVVTGVPMPDPEAY